jgi:nucleoside-diphosphate-sugar epimerase
VLVVGGAGRVGTRLVTTLRQMGVATRVMTRDPSSAASARLAALGAEIMKGDVTDDDTTRLDAAVEGCTRVVACFGAQRISKPADALFFFDERNGPNVTDKTHPAWVNYRGVAALCEACVKAGTVRRLVRVTGMSAGYPPFDFIAVALNAVLSMTIRWQRQGEKAVRALHDSNIQYCVVRPGNLLDGPRLEGSVVLIGHGGARVPAGKVSRDDVAECVLSATFVDAAANATVGIAGKPFSTNGVKSEMSWDPARGMHYKTVLLSDDDVYEGTDVHALMREIKPDEDALEPRTYEPYVVLFFLLVSGIFVLSGVGFAAAAKWLLGTVFKVGTGVSA